jgi:hypothetical protein
MVTSPHPGPLLAEVVVQPGTWATGDVLRGQHLEIVDVEGEQVADFCSFDLADPTEPCDVIYTRCAKGRWRDITTGDRIYTSKMRPLWTIVDDTCGTHDWGGGFCSRPLNEWAGVHQDGCREALEAALASRGLDAVLLNPSSCFNVFMNTPYNPDGSWGYVRPTSRAGDRVLLRAERDALWIVSCCHYPGICNGDQPTPLAFRTYERVAGWEASATDEEPRTLGSMRFG